MRKSPVVLGGCMLLIGYLWAMICRRERSVSDGLMAFRRREQMDRLGTFLNAWLPSPARIIPPKAAPTKR